MKNRLSNFTLIIISSLFFECAFENKSKIKTDTIQISWVNDLKGDYKFTQQWDYQEGIYKNEFNQLVCDGLCPEGIENKLGDNGKIIQDSMAAYYKLVDTSHIPHSIQCEAWCYEYAGTNMINVIKNKDTIECYTQQNAATHCSLKLKIINSDCTPTIELMSIALNANKTYTCNGGDIKIDKIVLQKDTLKAEFNFTFDHSDDSKQLMYWKGKILQKINNIH
jgi:hypothetical protein